MTLLFPLPFLSPQALWPQALPPATVQSSLEKAQGNHFQIEIWASSFTMTMAMLVVGSRILYSILETWAEFQDR